MSYQSASIKNLISDYSYLSGSQSKAQVTAQWQWSASRLFAGTYANKMSYQDTSTYAASYLALGGSLVYRYLFLPFDGAVTLLAENRAYSKAASDSSARTDSRYYAQVEVGYFLNRETRTYVNAGQTLNQSSFNTSTNNRSYSQLLVSLGLSYGF